MRGSKESQLAHGGRQLSNMSKLELIDFSFEDDSLLPTASSLPEDKPFDSVLRFSPSVKNEKKTPGDRQILFSAGSQEAFNKVSSITPRAQLENDAASTDSAFAILDANGQGGPRLIKSEPCTTTLGFVKSSGDMAKGEEKPLAQVFLTPTRARAVSWNDSVSESAERQQVKEAGKLQENHDDGKENRSNQDQQHVGRQSADPPAPDVPPRKTRSARAMHSLRRSLAWDKAFSTDEGILDGDELPIVAKTPKKLVDLPPLDLPDIFAIVSPPIKSAPTPSVEAPAIDGETSVALKPISDSSEHAPNCENVCPINAGNPKLDLGRTEVVSTTGNSNAPILSGARHLTSQSPSATSPMHIKALSAIPRPVPVTQIIEAAVEKGTKLRLPGSVAHGHNDLSRGSSSKKLEKGAEELLKHELNAKAQKDMEQTVHVKPLKETLTLTRCRSTSSLIKPPSGIKPPSTSTSLSKRVSSVSRKVKDTLGRVLPGSMGGRSSTSRKAIAETAHADRLRPTAPAPGLKVPGSPGPSYLTRSKSARAAVNGGAETISNVQKAMVFADLSNRNSSSKASGKPPTRHKKSKGESIWGSLRGKSGSSSAKGSENLTLNTAISSPRALKKAGDSVYEIANSHLHDLDESHPEASSGISTQNSKSSGLRLPSSKFGFFDAGRPTSAPEKPPLAVTDVFARHGLPPRPPSQHGSTTARLALPATVDPLVAAVRGYVSSGIPNPSRVTRASSKVGRKGLVSSASAPASPRKNSEMLSPGTHQAVTGRYLTSRSNSTRVHIQASPEPRKEKESSGAARKLTLEDNDGQLLQIEREAEEAAIKLSFSEAIGCEEEGPTTEDTTRIKCSNQPAEASVASISIYTAFNTAVISSEEVPKTHVTNGASSDTSTEKITDTVVLSEEVRDEGKRTDGNMNDSSKFPIKSKQSLTPDETGVLSRSDDVIDRVLVEGSLSESKKESIDSLVSSLNNSPSIQSTFWKLQQSSASLADTSAPKVIEASPSANDGSAHEEKDVKSEDGGLRGRGESNPEVLDQICNLRTTDEHQEKFNSEHASSSLGRDHGRRKSIFGWQEMHASLSSPVSSNGARSEEQTTEPQQSDMSVSPPSPQEKPKARASFASSTTIPSPLVEKSLEEDFSAEQVDNVRKQEPGQIMNGAFIDDMRTDSSKQENAWNSSTQCSSSEKNEESIKVHPTRTPEKENLRAKLEDFFESHWSGWPVLEPAATSSSSARRTSVVKGASLDSATPDSRRGSDGAENSRDGSTESFKKGLSPMSDADSSVDGRNSLALNRGLLSTAVEGSRLSITPPLKKERGLLAFARSAVSRLTSSGGSSPRHESSKAIDRDGPGSGSFRKSRRNKSNATTKPVDPPDDNEHGGSQSPFSEERIRALEAAVEEAVLMKKSTGAVQHSPPNKSQPPPNPWSPVKRPGQQPGPFDCTKKTTVNALVL